MTSSAWQTLLDHARNEDEVAAICNQFVSTWTAEELAQLPPGYRPDDAIEFESIAPYALKLIAGVGVGDRSTAPLLYRMSTFFTKAALRLAEVMAVEARRSSNARSSGSGSSTSEG